MRRLLLLLLPLALLCACTTAPAEQADAPFSFYYRCAEVAYGGEDGVIRAEAAPLEPDAGLRTVVLQYLKGPASPELFPCGVDRLTKTSVTSGKNRSSILL